MQRKNILFALAALGMLIGGVAVANASTAFLNNSTVAGGHACVDDDAESDEANEVAETDTEADDGPDDQTGATECDSETDDGPEDAEEADDRK